MSFSDGEAGSGGGKRRVGDGSRPFRAMEGRARWRVWVMYCGGKGGLGRSLLGGERGGGILLVRGLALLFGMRLRLGGGLRGRVFVGRRI